MTKILQGDCREVMKTLPDCSVDSIVTDPPYGLSFMGKKWDYDVPSVEVWVECLRVLKPGGHLLAFAGTRTQHRMACRIEDAGFEIRDMIAWVYSQGFPKSLDVRKAIDKAAGAEREVVGNKTGRAATPRRDIRGGGMHTCATRDVHGYDESLITAPATSAARQWQGWGTALKPALEPITVARKPLVGTVAENVQEFGTGAINIDGCRVETSEEITNHSRGESSAVSKGKYGDSKAQETHQTAGQANGRWPANLIHDGSEEVVSHFPQSNGQMGNLRGGIEKKPHNCFGDYGQTTVHDKRGDTGSAARFFYCAKASKSDRDEGCGPAQVFETSDPRGHSANGDGTPRPAAQPRANTHPTVKPTDLMRYLCRLVTPPGGVVLDPFMGSGSTGKAAIREGFGFIGIELDPAHIETATARIGHAATTAAQPAQMGLGL